MKNFKELMREVFETGKDAFANLTGDNNEILKDAKIEVFKDINPSAYSNDTDAQYEEPDFDLDFGEHQLLCIDCLCIGINSKLYVIEHQDWDYSHTISCVEVPDSIKDELRAHLELEDEYEADCFVGNYELAEAGRSDDLRFCTALAAFKSGAISFCTYESSWNAGIYLPCEDNYYKSETVAFLELKLKKEQYGFDVPDHKLEALDIAQRLRKKFPGPDQKQRRVIDSYMNIGSSPSYTNDYLEANGTLQEYQRCLLERDLGLYGNW